MSRRPRAAPEAGPAVVADAFRQRYGRPPDGVWSAPGRVNLIGEHTDYNAGLVLPFAIPARTWVAAGRRPDRVVSIASLQRPGHPVEADLDRLAPGQVTGWAGYVAGVPWVLQHSGHRLPGLDVVVNGRVPAGAGLSSSAALECAVALAVDDLAGLGLTYPELAVVAQRAENDFVGMPCGLMDQMAAMACTDGHALFFDTRSGAVEQVPLALDGAGLAVLVVDTRVHHALAGSEYAARRASCAQAAAALGVGSLREVDAADLDRALARLDDVVIRRRVRHVVTENARALAAVDALRRDAWAEVGAAMTASHTSLRDDYEVSCVEVDVAVRVLLAAGALGARITGGGFGGSAIALLAADATAAAGRSVAQAYQRAGYAPPQPRVMRPSAGARRDT